MFKFANNNKQNIYKNFNIRKGKLDDSHPTQIQHQASLL